MRIRSLLSFIVIALTSVLLSAQSADNNKPAFRLYDFEYQIMPMIANAAIPGELNEEALLDVKPVIKELADGYGLNLEFNPDEIIAQPFVREDVRGIVYTFPEPFKMPLAKYGAIIFTSVTENRYLTLESSLNFGEGEEKCWVLGETTEPGHHSNFGIVPDCDSPEAFIDLLEKMDKLKPLKTDTDERTSITVEENKK
ncbi:MAG: hypothetical protein K2K47_09000 [Duncaniella sp.]|nr:hypothetical protein [Duncaniella sp.]